MTEWRKIKESMNGVTWSADGGETRAYSLGAVTEGASANYMGEVGDVKKNNRPVA
jgi:hypothetical protein